MESATATFEIARLSWKLDGIVNRAISLIDLESGSKVKDGYPRELLKGKRVKWSGRMDLNMIGKGTLVCSRGWLVLLVSVFCFLLRSVSISFSVLLLPLSSLASPLFSILEMFASVRFDANLGGVNRSELLRKLEGAVTGPAQVCLA